MTRDSNGSIRINFLAAEEMKRLRNFRRMKIGNHRVQIKWLGHNYRENISNQVADMLFNPPDQDSPLNILNALNDHCLFKIFEENALEMSDLGAIGRVCKRFYRIAQRIYSRKYRNATNDDRRFGMLCRFYDHFYCFGSTITSLNLTRLHHQPAVLGMLAEHCPNLVSLTCDVREKSTYSDLHKLSAYLKELHLYFHLQRVAACDLDQILGENSSLELLDLHSNNAPVHLPTVILPHLVDLQMCRVILSAAGDFFEKNKRLKKLTLDDASIEFEDSEKSFGHLSNLQEFSCIFYVELFPLRRKYGREFNEPEHVRPILESLIKCNAPLEKVVVKNPLRMDLVTLCIIKDIRNVKYLDITLDFAHNDVFDIFENLHNLNEVRIEGEDLTIRNIFSGLLVSTEKLKKAWFKIIRRWDDFPITGGNDNSLIALAELAEQRNMEIDVVVKAKYGGIMVSPFTFVISLREKI